MTRTSRSSGLYRILLHVLPRDVRQRDGAELLAAFDACLARERARLGLPGMVAGWLRAILDLVTAAFVIRGDRRRARRIAALGTSTPSNGDHTMRQVWQDVKYAARRTGQAPVFSAAVVLTLALATGATTAIFSVVDTVLLKGLPYANPEKLAILYLSIAKAIDHPVGFSPSDWGPFEERATLFQSVAAFRNREYELSGIDRPERIVAVRASAALFDTLGVRPALGRAFSRQEDEGAEPVAVLSDALWRRAFAADPNAVGRSIALDRRPYTIVGVMPPRFIFPNRGPVLNNIPADVFLPISFTAGERSAFGSMYNNSVVARLKPGVTIQQANAEVAALVHRNALETYPASLQGLAGILGTSVIPLREETVGRASALLYVLFSAILVVLLIACADIAALMLTRAVTRQREMAVRRALGAGRGRLIRQSLAESAVLAVAGTALGLAVSRWAVAALVAAAPPTLPRLHEIHLDVRVLGFTAALSIVTAVLCGLLPALEASRAESSEGLKEGGRTGAPGRRHRRVFGVLVIAQFSLAVVLLVGGGLLVRSFTRLMAVNPGFDATRVLTLATSLPASAYQDGASVREFYGRLLPAIEQLPGVTSVAASTALPLAIPERRAFTIENERGGLRDLPYSVAHDWVAGAYFETLGIPLKRGRYLGAQDSQSAERVVVINETMARTFWRDEDPVGQRIAWGGPVNHAPWMRIVGVVADVKQGPLNSAVVPQTFTPWVQLVDRMLGENVVGQLRSLKISVRSAAEPLSLAAAVRAQVRALDPSLPVSAVQTLEGVVRASAAPQRFNAIVLGSFAALALLLAALGIAGILAVSVSRRTQELGLRMALGAQRPWLLLMVVREGMILAVTGLIIGLAAAFGLTRMIASLLFEVRAWDPATFASVAALLLAVASVACYVPARRATSVDPIAALRRE